MSLFRSRIPSSFIYLSDLLGFFQFVTIFHTFFSFIYFLNELGIYICIFWRWEYWFGILLTFPWLQFVRCISHDKAGVKSFWEEGHRDTSAILTVSSIWWYICHQYDLWLDIDLTHLAEMVLFRFLHCGVTPLLSPSSYWTLCKAVLCLLHLWSGELHASSLWAGFLQMLNRVLYIFSLLIIFVLVFIS